MLKVYRRMSEIPPDGPPSAITIGNFDGVHVAHQRLLERVVHLGRGHGWVPSVLTFHPHPSKVVAPDRAPRLLSQPEERLALMERAGIEQVFLFEFDRQFSQLTAEEFVSTVLEDALRARAVVVGANFRFGHGQRGDVRLLEQLGRVKGFCTEVVAGVSLRGSVVSSTQVRQALVRGEVSRACRLLGRPYAISGEVVSGFGIGSKQTVPTLNLATNAEIVPADGVYITETEDVDSGRRWRSITNVGVRPTFDGASRTVETYVLENLQEPHPLRIRVAFLRRVREERKFESAEQLKHQIVQDVQRAEVFFRRRRRWVK